MNIQLSPKAKLLNSVKAEKTDNEGFFLISMSVIKRNIGRKKMHII